MAQQGDGASGSGGQKRKAPPPEYWKLPDTEDEPPRDPEPAEDIFVPTLHRYELSKSWQEALDRAAAGERSGYVAPANVNREAAPQHTVQNQPEHVYNQPGASSSTAIVIGSDDDDDDDVVYLDTQPPAQPKR